MKYYLIAGEASGDIHGANLIAAIKKLDPHSNFRCWGGDLMEAQGAVLAKHIRELAFMGFVEVLKNIRTIFKNIKSCKSDIIAFSPDVVILIDYPGFNLRISKFIHKNGIKSFYYISPSVWAWKTSRIQQIKKYITKMFVILPFEKDFYARYQCNVEYEGHPLMDAIEIEKKKLQSKEDLIQEQHLNQKEIIALLPGSRKQEIKSMLPVMLNCTSAFPEYQFVIAASRLIPVSFYKEIIGKNEVNLVFGKTYSLMQHARAGFIKSGTSTLEACLFNLPQVVCYKGNKISIWIAKQLAKVKYISLPNLIMNKEIVKELIQEQMTEEQMIIHLKKIIDEGEGRTKMLDDYAEVQKRLGGPGASDRIAHKMLELLNHA